MSNDWWGEPLGAMLSRVLIEELGQRLPQSVVIGESGAVTASPDATIELNMQRLDEDAAGNLVLQAQASVSFKSRKGPVLRSFRFVVTPPAPGIPGKSQRSAPPSASSPTAWRRRCWGGDAVRGSAHHAAPAARMPGLRAVADGSGPGTWHDGPVRALPDDLAPHSAHRPDHIAALVVAAFVLLWLCARRI